jgi:hypothetical protein
MKERQKATTSVNGGITTTAVAQTSEPAGEQKIAALAYHFWLTRGCPEGTPEEDWFRAEQEIARSQETDI